MDFACPVDSLPEDAAPDEHTKIRRTADAVSVIRFQESRKEKPLVNDPFAHLFATPEGEKMLESALKIWPCFAQYIIAREKFFDDCLELFCRDNDLKQVVMLGAGYDMRASRLSFIRKKKVFEVDFPQQIMIKKTILLDALGSLSGNVAYIGADVTDKGLLEKLSESGFSQDEKSLFIIQGLIYYLTPEKVEMLFSVLSRIPAGKNIFLIDQVSSEMYGKFSDPERKISRPYPEDLSGYLSMKSFSVRESILLGSLTEKYFGKRYKDKWWVVVAEK